MSSGVVLIAGAGIGGLTAALCLAQKGFEVKIFEQADSISEIGAGIQLSPNCSRVLHYLGLEAAIRRSAFLPEASEIRHWKTGRMISANNRGNTTARDYGFPYYHIHRADLIHVLQEAALQNPNIEVSTSCAVQTFDQATDEIVLHCEAGEYRGDLLIGADGIHSTVRTGLFGQENPNFTGCVAWRGLVRASKLPQGKVRPVTGLWWGPGKHFVHYYVRSGDFVNCVCVIEKTGWEVESWTEKGDHAELKRDFEGWHDTIGCLIEAMEPDECYKWALYDRPPMTSWGSGRVTLLGDACHPTLPFMAQGAAMAVEDAAVLAACLEQDQVETAIRKYEQFRIDRTSRIQNGSRRNSKVFHMRGLQAWVRNRAATTVAGNTLDWIFRYNALDVAGNH